MTMLTRFLIKKLVKGYCWSTEQAKELVADSEYIISFMSRYNRTRDEIAETINNGLSVTFSDPYLKMHTYNTDYTCAWIVFTLSHQLVASGFAKSKQKAKEQAVLAAEVHAKHRSTHVTIRNLSR